MKQYIIVISALLVAGIFLHLVIFNPTRSFSSAAPVYYQSKISSGESTSSSTEAKGSIANPSDIFNSTLGFQEVFVVNLPERTDKRDAIAVQASLTNITFKLSPGVRGDTISEKAKPYGMEKLLPAEVGAWRAHLNVLQRVVENRISSTLILEDDADWDVSIKAQMTEFARGTRWLMNLTEQSHSPYGDGWDILWIGHCSAHSHHSDTRRWVIRKDLTVPPPNKRGSMLQPYDLGYWEGAPDFDTQTRIIYKAGYGFCFAGWAVSLRGAEKILHKLSMLPYELAVDLGVAEMCAHGTHNLICLAPFPAYVGISKPAGNPDRGSDIVDGNGKGRAGDLATRDNAGGKFRKDPESERVVFSTRMNIPRLLVGESEFESNYANVTGQVRSIDEITSFTGTGHDQQSEVSIGKRSWPDIFHHPTPLVFPSLVKARTVLGSMDGEAQTYTCDHKIETITPKDAVHSATKPITSGELKQSSDVANTGRQFLYDDDDSHTIRLNWTRIDSQRACSELCISLTDVPSSMPNSNTCKS